jgi:hypothetical protein
VLPAITAILFVFSIVGAFLDPSRGIVFAILFVGCVLDPVNQKWIDVIPPRTKDGEAV